MHRHGYQGPKFGRERDQRRALMKGLADSLVRDESIETTITKAKAIVPYIEKLVTKAKKGDLHNRRQVIRGLSTLESAHKLVDEIAPKLGARNSGHFRIERTTVRRGDNAQLARVSFVDDLKTAPVAKAAKQTAPAAATSKKQSADGKTPKAQPKKPSAKKTVAPKKAVKK